MQRDNPRRSQRKRSSYKVEHLPTHSHSPASRRLYSGDPVNSSKKPLDAGVLVCEALRERSEQRTNKYPEVGGCVSLGEDCGLGPAPTEKWEP